jgi:hypothetical protein
MNEKFTVIWEVDIFRSDIIKKHGEQPNESRVQDLVFVESGIRMVTGQTSRLRWEDEDGKSIEQFYEDDPTFLDETGEVESWEDLLVAMSENEQKFKV